MLKTIGMHLLKAYPEIVNKNSTINGFGNSEVDKAKVNIKTAKSKSKNLVRPFLANSQSSI